MVPRRQEVQNEPDASKDAEAGYFRSAVLTASRAFSIVPLTLGA